MRQGLALEGFECPAEGSGLMIKTPGAWEGFGIESPSKKITLLRGGHDAVEKGVRTAGRGGLYW